MLQPDTDFSILTNFYCNHKSSIRLFPLKFWFRHEAHTWIYRLVVTQEKNQQRKCLNWFHKRQFWKHLNLSQLTEKRYIRVFTTTKLAILALELSEVTTKISNNKTVASSGICFREPFDTEWVQL